MTFLSTLSLRRATFAPDWAEIARRISIHALLAESDHCSRPTFSLSRRISIHALLAESDIIQKITILTIAISIHALLAESDELIDKRCKLGRKFLSTLSLRRATEIPNQCKIDQQHFYPRSPCGERPLSQSSAKSTPEISIHALLAESDPDGTTTTTFFGISIHALLAESDILLTMFIFCSTIFLSTLSLRRATLCAFVSLFGVFLFLSTLSLRRATGQTLTNFTRI